MTGTAEKNVAKGSVAAGKDDGRDSIKARKILGLKGDAAKVEDSTADPVEALLTVKENLNKFWKAHGSGFTDVWEKMSSDARKSFIKECNPTYPEAESEFLLAPEMSVSHLTEGSNLMKIFELWTEAEISDLAFRTLSYIRMLALDNRLVPQVELMSDVFIHIQVKESFGKPITLTEKSRDQDRDFLKSYLEQGAFATTVEFDWVMTRLYWIVHALGGFATEYSEIYLKKPASNMYSPHTGCGNCGRSKAKDGSSLKVCQLCKVQSYCSRDCQVADWKKDHKLRCRGKRSKPQQQPDPLSIPDVD
ncbi:hypothetical protein DFS34DRAFT_646485 [Phlyctochytrium arcticum]|nr:hypothetical protein DFS34DRAFT_646485 [Phlyctochytrium arcticum]